MQETSTQPEATFVPTLRSDGPVNIRLHHAKSVQLDIARRISVLAGWLNKYYPDACLPHAAGAPQAPNTADNGFLPVAVTPVLVTKVRMMGDTVFYTAHGSSYSGDALVYSESY